jgi:flagellar basal-body rod protein FlgG
LNTSLLISSSALQAYQQKIDTAANNVANVNTNGFKRKDQSFSEILASQLNNQTRANAEVGRLTPDGIRVGYGTRTGLIQQEMTQGQPIETGNPLDLMIQGKGFFQVGYPLANAAEANEIRYTRDGNFHASPNPDNPGSYRLVNANGGFLLDQNGAPIEIDGQYEVSFQPNGQLLLKNKDGQGVTFASAQEVGIVEIQNPQSLKNMGGNEYAVDPALLADGTPITDFVRMMAPGESQISSGYLEGSNVDLAKEMVDLMATQRSFQMNARAISYGDQMLGIANGIVK